MILAVTRATAATLTRLTEAEADELRELGVPVVVARVKGLSKRRAGSFYSKPFLVVRPGLEWAVEAIARWPRFEASKEHLPRGVARLRDVVRMAIRLDDRDLIDAGALLVELGWPIWKAFLDEAEKKNRPRP